MLALLAQRALANVADGGASQRPVVHAYGCSIRVGIGLIDTEPMESCSMPVRSSIPSPLLT